MKKAAKIIIAIIIAYIIIFITDFTLVLNEKNPVFCIIKSSKETDLCHGLGYTYEITPHPITGKREYTLFIFGQAVSSNVTNGVQTDEQPQTTEATTTETQNIPLLSDGSPDDYLFYADSADNEITDENVISQIWEMLVNIESLPPVTLDENDTVGSASSFIIMLKHRSTGEEYTLSSGILYENPNNDGGPALAVIRSKSFTAYYNAFYSDDGETWYGISPQLTAPPEITATETADETSSRKSNIVVVSCQRNDFYRKGTFIDIDGKVYEYDFTDEKIVDNNDFVSRLEDYYHSADVGYTQTVQDPDLLWKIAALSDSISPNAEIAKEQTSSDTEPNTVYVLNSDSKLIKLYSNGSVTETNTDRYAIEAADLCRIL